MLKPRASTPTRTLGDIGLEKLGRLANALGLSHDEHERAQALFGSMTRSLSHWGVGARSPWPNDITDDGTPFEYSLAFEKATPELRWLIESQAPPVSDVSTWNAGLSLNEALRASGAYLGTFDRIKGLFTPSFGPVKSFSLWHGAALGNDRALFKAYLNPQIHGAASAPGLVEKALRRLGRSDAWEFLAHRFDPTEKGRDIRFFSVDLVDAETARVKIYVARSTLAGVEEILHGTKNASPGAAADWISTLTASTARFDARPILTCFAFGAAGTAPSATLHVPIRCYSPNDEESFERIKKLLSSEHAARLEAALVAIADRPLAAKAGIITYASLSNAKAGTRATVYLAPECFSAVARSPRRATGTSGTRRIEPSTSVALETADLEKALEDHLEVLVRHPFFKRLDENGALTQFRSALRPMALFSLVLDDARRLAREHGSEPWFEELARALEPNEGGRRWWQLGDLEFLGISSSLEWLFAEEHRSVRDVLYRLASQVTSARSDYARLAVLLVFNVVMREFFVRASAYLTRTSMMAGHASIAPPPSQRGEVLDRAVLQRLRKLDASGTAFGEMDAALSSAFAAMTSLADELESSLQVA